MTRGALETPLEARKAPTELARATTPSMAGWVAFARLVIAVAVLTLGHDLNLRAANPSPDGQIIREIRIEGNASVATEKIRAEIKTRTGRPLDRALVDVDLHRIQETKQFSEVTYTISRAPDGNGVILTFQVVEMPVLNKVEFIGRTAVRLKDIEESTGLKKGARADSVRARLAVQQIKQLYVDKGYEKVEVVLKKGGDSADREVIISIFEGPKFKVGKIDFVGNSFVSDAVLQTKLASKKPLFGISLLGHYEKDGYDEDASTLINYYQSNGFLEVQVRPVVRAGADLGERDVTFVIDEGMRFKVRKVVVEGNKVLTTDSLVSGLKLHSGQFFSDSVRDADKLSLTTRYHSLGHIDAQVQVEPKATPQPDVVDLVYKIEEGDQYRLGQLIVKGNQRTKDAVVRRHANYAALLPGELLDSSKLDKFKQRLSNTNYFQNNPQKGSPVDVKIINRRPASKPFGDDPIVDMSGVNLARFQNPDDAPGLPEPPPIEAPPEMPSVAPGGVAPGEPFGGGASNTFNPPPNTMPSIPIPSPIDRFAPFADRPRKGPGSGQPNGPARSQFDQSNPSGAAPGVMSNNLNSNITDRQEPFTANRAYADVVASVDEAPTASFVAGFGASSFGGLYGSVSFTENNFNILAFPRSFDDFRQQRAFRGAGQQFSIELSPGTLINYYSLRFFDPAIFDLPLGFGLQGYQSSRYFRDWKEQRSGGKMSFAHQFGTQSAGEIGIRAEDVNLNGFRYPAPALLLDSAGHTTLISIRPSFKIDTRDNPFLTNSGHYAEIAYEQGFGTYTFGKVTAEGRQYFTTGSRPDGSGKRVLTVRGYMGFASQDTPIYERFYAGNLNSLRGFQYRGIGPFVLGVNTGGIMQSLTSVEYRFPWNAKDTFQQVVFVDSGTVENTYAFTNYRVAVGTGIRVMIPQIFKQVPLAFDLAFPLSKGPNDRLQAFNFSIGGSW
jgi:outer membrane protein insertion porin family